jgi:uncharacterized protein
LQLLQFNRSAKFTKAGGFVRTVAVVAFTAVTLLISISPTKAQLSASRPVGTPALQPSFDCAKAAAPIEGIICADPELAQWDRRMGEAYKRRFASLPAEQRGTLLEDQRHWIASRNARCPGVDAAAKSCILQMTQARFDILDATPAFAAPPIAQDRTNNQAPLDSPQGTSCRDESADLKRLATGIRTHIEASQEVRAGSEFQFSWETSTKFSSVSPIYIVLAIPGDARFEVKFDPEMLKKATSGSREAIFLSFEPQISGLVALLPESRAPHGIGFGAGKTRAFIPLHQEGSHRRGSFSVQMFDSGTFELQTTVVAWTGCSEHLVKGISVTPITVVPAPPQIVVQDPYDIDVPERSIVSNSGRYLAQIFPGRYRVFDVATGAKLIDRAGHNPNFSPTSRFVVADIGLDFEVIDLASREVVAQPNGPFVGWIDGDAFLIDGGAKYGTLQLIPTLLSRESDSKTDHLRFVIAAGCRPCRSWSSSANFVFDLDAGIVGLRGIGPFSKKGISVYELASGFETELADEEQAAKFARDHYNSKFASPWIGWNADAPILFSQVDSYFGDKPGEDAEGIRTYAAWTSLRKKLQVHREIPPKAVIHQIAELTGTVQTRGDWFARDFGRAPPTTTTKAEKLLARLSDFDLSFPMTAAKDATRFWEEDRSQVAAFRERLVREIPITGGILSLSDDFHRHGASLWIVQVVQAESGSSPNKIILDSRFKTAWRWDVEGKPFWLLQFAWYEGTDQFANDELVIVDGREPQGRVLNLGTRIADFMRNRFSVRDRLVDSNERTELKTQLVLGRYLVIGSIADQSIVLYDIKSDRVLATLMKVAQADLMEDVRLSADAKTIVQINRDGQFFLYDVSSGRNFLSGRYVDDEIILYTSEGYYWSSYEGAHFVQLRFPGLRPLYPFPQFASVLDRPDIIKRRFKDPSENLTQPDLTPPPDLNISFAGQQSVARENNELLVRVNASSSVGLSHLRFFNDGQLVRDLDLTGNNFKGEVSVPRSANARWLTALATDTKGFLSAPVALRQKPQAVGQNRLYAILVGNDHYSDESINLSYAGSDARRLADALRSRGSAYYSEQNVELLLDASSQAIIPALERLASTAKSGDTILFFFAGHGVKGKDGAYYLMPSNSDLRTVEKTALAWSRLAEILDKTQARIVVMLDACHSGLSGSQGLATNDNAVEGLLSGTHAPILVLAASKGRQVSFEAKKWGGGVFTYALLGILAKGGSINGNHDAKETIDVSELYQSLREVVSRETRGLQTPWLARQDLIGNFALF